MALAQDSFAAERERNQRATIADVLLQLIVQGVVSKDATPVALAALGLVWPDLEGAMKRRRRVGWTGPRPGPVPVVAQPPTIPFETPTERREHVTNASHQQEKWKRANPEPGMRRCARCHEVKPIEEFALRSVTSGSTQRRSYCPPCWKEKQKERYLSVKKARLLNEVGLTFVVADGDDVEGLACLNCLRPIKPGETVHGRASLVHDSCPEP